ncbi:MAG: endopeptidase La, partial [Calditrichota bacterium]
PQDLPLFLSPEIIVFPGVLTPMVVQEESQVTMINEVLAGDVKIFAMALIKKTEPAEEGEPNPQVETYDIGSAVGVVRMMRIPDGSLRLAVQGLSRIQIKDVRRRKEDGLLIARVEPLTPAPASGVRIEALMRAVRDEFSEVIDIAPYLPTEMKVALVNINEPGPLADFIAANLNVKPEERQAALAEVEIEKRLKLVSRLLRRELEMLRLSGKIQSEVTENIEKNQREYFLREQLKAIRRELGDDQEGAEAKALQERLQKLDAPDNVKEVAAREIERLGRISTASAEYTVARTYIDWLLDLPWKVSTEDRIEIDQARKILERDHYGLDDVKERILEFLAVKKLKGSGRGSILCFVGPPGVGKTSIGRSIAEAMGRKFVRMSLGGLRDEAEIRGHRRTYIGALPGRIIHNLKRAGSNNPVFMLDEIDKLGSDFRGDPSSAMLEVLDPEQNFSFQDNYLEVDFDLSQVMFITTANYLETIPPPLRDRMEIINLPGYVTPEKVQIAKRYLAPRQLKENGLTSEQLSFTDSALEQIAVYYTREAGVRTLERTIGKVCRKVAVRVVSHQTEKVSVTSRNYTDYLGAPRVTPDLHNRTPQVGIANGLAWTPVGGVMLVIEAISMPGEGHIKITGQLGDVMKESAEIALSYLRKWAAKLKIPQDYFKKNDFHIHIPEGATPKDGPSAGITITSALASLFTNRPLRPDLAMTGEITLQGRVLPIGGLREKSVAAVRGHMKTLICPADNRSDLEEIPAIVKEKLEFKFVESMDEVLKAVLLPREKKRRKDVPEAGA